MLRLEIIDRLGTFTYEAKTTSRFILYNARCSAPIAVG